MRMRRIVCALAAATGLLSIAASAATAGARLTCRVVDAETGDMLPCRVYVESPEGQVHFVKSADPRGSAVIYGIARSSDSIERHTTVSAHPFFVDVPAGKYSITVERGKEYRPATVTVIVRDEAIEQVIHLKRWINMAQRGWYSGETHVHRSLEELPNVVLAEDLNVALPLSYWVRDAYTAPGSGRHSAAATGELISVDESHVIWPMNTEYELFTVNGKRHTLGAVFVLNHKQPLAPAAPPVAPIAQAARKQDALLDLDKHSWPWSMMLVPIMDVDLFELSNNHVWRTNFFFSQWTLDLLPQAWDVETDADGFTEWGWIDFGFKTYYALLNCGFRMRPTAGTASGVHPVPLGYGRVYVHLPDGFNYDDWMAGLDAGRSFVTTGPMLLAEFDGQPPGTSLDIGKTASIRVKGSAYSNRPLTRVEIVMNGKVIRVVSAENRQSADGGLESRFDERVHLPGSSWIAVRCFEGEPGRDRIRFAHTAPVHVDVAGLPLRPRRFETEFLVRAVESEIERNRGVLAEDEMAEYERALQIYRDLHEGAVARD